jgi:malto-oligosyltrehalose trehalohydrolase
MTVRTTRYAHEMSFGAAITAKGVRFRLWAPDSGQIDLRIIGGERDVAMQKMPFGWHQVEVEGIGEGALYSFVLGDGSVVPDPASRHQPQGVHGPSQVIDPRRFEWHDLGWQGRPWEEVVCYELHVGTFTQEGTFAAAADKLEHLARLGITAIELMPIAEFSGRWNWGYDGVSLFAPDHTYGTPDDLKTLVARAHRLGIMVFLDVVYNHFGPEGNYMASYAPLLTDKHETPWGAAVNFDDVGASVVREMIIANTRFWLDEYRFDGLRFDAVHAIRDEGPRHLLIELAEQARGYTDGRHVHLIVENSENEAGWLKRGERGRPWLFTAQWSDDIHHALHVTLTGEDHWYYSDFANRFDLVGRSLAEGFAFQGEYMRSESRYRGEATHELPITAFLGFVQNHDQIGNRPHGDRLIETIGQDAYRAFAATVMLAPTIPMLFMGEEFGATTPFEYFSDVQELAEDIRGGREEELRSVPENLRRQPLPDPMAQETFERSTLDWTGVEDSDWVAWYRRLIAARHAHVVPHLIDTPAGSGRFRLVGERGVVVTWRLGGGATETLAANFGDAPIAFDDLPTGEPIWCEGTRSAERLDPLCVVVWIEPGGS